MIFAKPPNATDFCQSIVEISFDSLKDLSIAVSDAVLSFADTIPRLFTLFEPFWLLGLCKEFNFKQHVKNYYHLLIEVP